MARVTLHREETAPTVGAAYSASFPDDLGPGTLEVWSPDAFARWTITQIRDGKTHTVTRKTGPGSHTAVYVDGGVSARAVVVATMSTIHASLMRAHVFDTGLPSVTWADTFIDPNTYTLPTVDQAPAPRLVWRFWPLVQPDDLLADSGGQELYFRGTPAGAAYTETDTQDGPRLAAQTTGVDLMYAPGFARWVRVESGKALTWSLLDPFTATPIAAGTAVDRAVLPLGAWMLLYAATPVGGDTPLRMTPSILPPTGDSL